MINRKIVKSEIYKEKHQVISNYNISRTIAKKNNDNKKTNFYPCDDKYHVVNQFTEPHRGKFI